jgi:hypothetical protein
MTVETTGQKGFLPMKEKNPSGTEGRSGSTTALGYAVTLPQRPKKVNKIHLLHDVVNALFYNRWLILVVLQMFVICRLIGGAR